MPRRVPLIPTIIVAVAIAVMFALGGWQLQRAAWKEGLLARLEANKDLPPIAYPSVPDPDEAILFRRAGGFCVEPVSTRVTAGRNAAETSGWSYLATCRTNGAEGPGMVVDIGWSRSHTVKPNWSGGEVDGVIAPDGEHVIRLVSVSAAPGLEPSQPPGPDTIPNNHRFYAAQWFLFAGFAGLIYALVLRKRRTSP